MILLARETVVFLFAESVLLIVLTVAATAAWPVARRWDFGAVTARQYRLERRSHLVELVVAVVLALKLALLPYFGSLIDSLAALVPGAMCGAGVIHSNPQGMPLLAFKLLVLAGAGLWLLVNREDLRAPDHPHLLAKLRLFFGVFALAVVETALDWSFLANIPTLTPVQCCSIIYGVAGGADELPLGLQTGSLLLLFGLVTALLAVAAASRYGLLTGLAGVAFLVLGYLSVVDFWGTYVYELPTHHCPFCMLQREYHYYGFALWGALLGAAFFAAAAWPLERVLGRRVRFPYIWCLVLAAVFAVLATAPTSLFYLRNGVWL